MTLNDLAKVIAKRNRVSSSDKVFTAADVAEYIFIYKNQMERMNQTPSEALETLFGDGVEESILERDLSDPIGKKLDEIIKKRWLEKLKNLCTVETSCGEVHIKKLNEEQLSCYIPDPNYNPSSCKPAIEYFIGTIYGTLDTDRSELISRIEFLICDNEKVKELLESFEARKENKKEKGVSYYDRTKI